MSAKIELPNTFANTTLPQTYSSPFSVRDSDNAQQGKLTKGALINQFDAPKLNAGSDEPIYPGYQYRSRLEQNDLSANKHVTFVNVDEPKEASKENYNGIPGFVDSHLVSENFTPEENLNIMTVLMFIIVICLVAFCFGYLVPRVSIFAKVAGNSNRGSGEAI